MFLSKQNLKKVKIASCFDEIGIVRSVQTMPRRQSFSGSTSTGGNPRKKMNKDITHINPHFSCPVCFELISEATITRCGHTYCSRCILKSIECTKKCPKCNQSLTPEQTFPNFLLNELIR